MEPVKRPVGRPRADGKPQISKAAVFQVATRLIAKYGYAGTSLRKIADELDVKAPSILNLFKTKERILVELVQFLAKFSLDFHDNLKTHNLAPDVALYKMILEEARAISGANKDVAAIFYLPELRLENFSAAQDERRKMLNHYRTVLKRGVKEGLFIRINIDLCAEQIFQLTETAIIALNTSKLGQPKAQAKGAADFVMRSILVNPNSIESISNQAHAIKLSMK